MTEFIETMNRVAWLPLDRCVISLDDNTSGNLVPARVFKVAEGTKGSHANIEVYVNAILIGDYEINHELALNETIPETARKIEKDNFYMRHSEGYECEEYEANEYIYEYSAKRKTYNLARFEFSCRKAEVLSKAGVALNKRVVEKRVREFYATIYGAIETALTPCGKTRTAPCRIRGFAYNLDLCEPPESEKKQTIYAWNLEKRTEGALCRHGLELAEDFVNLSESDLANIRGLSKDSAHEVYMAYLNRNEL